MNGAVIAGWALSPDVAGQHHQAGQEASGGREADQGFEEQGHDISVPLWLTLGPNVVRGGDPTRTNAAFRPAAQTPGIVVVGPSNHRP